MRRTRIRLVAQIRIAAAAELVVVVAVEATPLAVLARLVERIAGHVLAGLVLLVVDEATLVAVSNIQPVIN
jgi:hypothetical protein